MVGDLHQLTPPVGTPEGLLGLEIPLPVEVVGRGRFLGRPNRFIGVVQFRGREVRAHISDTGRLRELLYPGAEVYLSRNPTGKLEYKLIGAETPAGPILLYPPIHNRVGEELLRRGVLGFLPREVRREQRLGESRIDLLVDREIWVEIKGCNLQVGEWCLFPDAPTSRGSRHLRELGEVKGVLLLLLFRPCRHWRPHRERDPLFAETLRQVRERGVQIYPVGLETQFSPHPLLRVTHFPGVEL